MKLTTIDIGYFKLDGGAMFGVVPKTLWNRVQPADESNLCSWALRCLLIETDGRKIIVDTGMGNKQNEKFRSHFHPHREMTFQEALLPHGLTTDDITDVFITHLHFDHVGGALEMNDQNEIVPTFKNATYWSNQVHYDWAFDPNDREKASFLKENFVPLNELGILKMIPVENGYEWIPGIRVRYSNCHTEAMMLLEIDAHEGTFVYCADLLPSSFHLRMPWVMGYDIRPMLTLVEKEELFQDAIANDWVLYLEHDPETECIRISKDERGRYQVKEKGKLLDFHSRP